MRSRNKKKKKAAYRRGEKIMLYLKRGSLLLLALAVTAGAVLGERILTERIYVGEISVSGNYHLDKDEIVKSAGTKKGEALMKIDLEATAGNIRKNPWIKSVTLKKQFPHTFLINVEEAVPAALLSIKNQVYLIDKDGVILEKIQGESTPFLPVIKKINPENRKALSEALKLVQTLSENNTMISRDTIEIDLESYGLALYMDGELIKVGYGNYSKKFARWMELEPEVRRKGVPIKYVDLRFKDSVIIKPMELDKGKKSS